MKKKILPLFLILLLETNSFAQSITAKLQKAISTFQKDTQLENAIISIYVVDATSGEKIFANNETIGLATASCLKLVTSATTYDILGKDFIYKTYISYTGTIENGKLNGDIIIKGVGDPSFGSWRWEDTKSDKVLDKITNALQKKGINAIKGSIIIETNSNTNNTPGSWIWDDLGNYYGAVPRLFNYRENQFDIQFGTPNKLGEKAIILKTIPELPNVIFQNNVTTAEASSGDNTIIYLPQNATKGFVEGTLPINKANFEVSGAIPNPAETFSALILQHLKEKNISFEKNSTPSKNKQILLDSIISPTLEKLNYWFMRKSINLYGESFLNKIGELKNGAFSTPKGIEFVQQFWKQKGISPNALNIYDGSGLSPQNRVTTKALVTVLQYAQKQPWFASYYEAFPIYNEMKLKSGTIADVKGFSGYHTAKNGRKYIVSFLVNNYNGSASKVVEKMYKVLDELK
jgi:serine-type D-Ala-D-Ala carboxypeptidase/endopeptidase (penicillin-binding protein 4)